MFVFSMVLQKLQIYSRVKMATVKLGSASNSCLGQRVSVSPTELRIS